MVGLPLRYVAMRILPVAACGCGSALVAVVTTVVTTVEMTGLWVAVVPMGGLVGTMSGFDSGGGVCCWHWVAM